MGERGPDPKYPIQIFTNLSEEAAQKIEELSEKEGSRSAVIRKIVHSWLDKNYSQQTPQQDLFGSNEKEEQEVSI